MVEQNTLSKDTAVTSPSTTAVSIIDEAKKVRDEIRSENDRRVQMLEREEKMQAERMLGSSAGAQVPIMPAPKLSNVEYANKFMRGEVNPFKEDGISIN